MKHAITLLLITLMSVSAFSYDIEVEGLTYNLKKVDDEIYAELAGRAHAVVIDGLDYKLDKDSGTAMLSNGNTWEGELYIPATISHDGQTYRVTAIEWLAFDNCTTLTRVHIPASVTTIHHYAGYEACKNPFDGCTALECIDVAADNSAMCAVGGVLFNKDTTQLWCRPAGLRAESYEVPKSVTLISGNALANNPYVKDISVHDAVESINFGVFSGCKSLEHITFPSKMTHIPSSICSNTPSLRSVTIPDGITAIAEYAFAFSGLETVTLPEGLSSLTGQTFYGCTSLQSAVLPSTLSSITNGMFYGCTALTEVTLANGIRGIGMSAFQGCTALKVLDLPTSVCGISPYAFKDCRMEALVIRGLIDKDVTWEYIFSGLDVSTPIYTVDDQIATIRQYYSGPVYPLSQYNPKASINACTQIINSKSVNRKCFDLSGRHLAGPPARGLYIEDGTLKAK